MTDLRMQIAGDPPPPKDLILSLIVPPPLVSDECAQLIC